VSFLLTLALAFALLLSLAPYFPRGVPILRVLLGIDTLKLRSINIDPRSIRQRKMRTGLWATIYLMRRRTAHVKGFVLAAGGVAAQA
jgi:hypothetical protein